MEGGLDVCVVDGCFLAGLEAGGPPCACGDVAWFKRGFFEVDCGGVVGVGDRCLCFWEEAACVGVPLLSVFLF